MQQIKDDLLANTGIDSKRMPPFLQMKAMLI